MRFASIFSHHRSRFGSCAKVKLIRIQRAKQTANITENILLYLLTFRVGCSLQLIKTMKRSNDLLTLLRLAGALEHGCPYGGQGESIVVYTFIAR